MDQKRNLLLNNFKSINFPRSNLSLTDESGYDSDGSLGSCRSLRRRQRVGVHNLNSPNSSSISDWRGSRYRLNSSPYHSVYSGSSTKSGKKIGLKSYSENQLSFSSECTKTSTPFSDWSRKKISNQISSSFLCSVPKLIFDTPTVCKPNSSAQSSGFFELESVIDLDEYKFHSLSGAQNVLQLIHKFAPYLLTIVFSYLEGKDLLSISQVNSEFKALIGKHSIFQSKIAAYKKEQKLYREKLEKQKENIKVKKGVAAADFIHSNPRSPLKDMQKRNLPVKPPVPMLSLFDRFVKEGKKLAPGEIQQKCVHCHWPAKLILKDNIAVCASETCKYVFCTRCFLKEHKSPSECPSLMPRPKVSTMKLISKACKKRLRRL